MTEPAAAQRIWVRSCQNPTAKLAPLPSTRLIGGNQGNLLYQFSTYRALCADSAQLSTISYAKFDKNPVEDRAEWINSECDHLVLPLSSSFRLQMLETLRKWAELIEKLTIPVTVVGIGAQLRLSDVKAENYRPSRVTGVTAPSSLVDEHEAVSRRFMSAVLDRSNSIGVRGEITKRYLQYLGFPGERIEVIGCPSVFMWGPDFRMPTDPLALGPRSRISLSFDHRIPTTADLFDRTVNTYPGSVVYAQERMVAQMVITGEETRPDWAGDPRFPVKTSHPLYRQHRMEYQPTGWSWIERMKHYDFAFGPRLHGTVAATLAGTPAHLLVHDSRTLEVAQYHQLPHSLIEKLTSTDSASALAERTDYEAFNAAYPELLNRFVDFLTSNGLPNAYTRPGKALSDFDQSLATATSATGVLSAAKPPSTLRQRLGRIKRRLLGNQP